MAINLKKTNVVIIGAGAAGGVAGLPLAQAGIEVIGLEAGGWGSPRDMAPDELRYLRGWPPQVPKSKYEKPTPPPPPPSPATRAARWAGIFYFTFFTFAGGPR